MKEFRFDKDGNPVEVVEVNECQEVQLAPGGGTVHVYLHLRPEVVEKEKEDSGWVWVLVFLFMVFMMSRWL